MEKRAELALAKAEKGVKEHEKNAKVGLSKVKEQEERVDDRL
jgi:hypothetical protein